MEVLRWTGRPRMALINLISTGDHVAEWRAALGAVLLDRARLRCRARRLRQAHRAPACLRRDRRALGGAVESCGRRPRRGTRSGATLRAAGEIADFLLAALTATVTVPLREGSDDRERACRALARSSRTKCGAASARRAAACRRSTSHAGLEARESARRVSRRGRLLGAELQCLRPLAHVSSHSRARPRARSSAASSTWRSAAPRCSWARASAPRSARSALSRAPASSRR